MRCAKTAELIYLLFGLWTLVSRRKHKFNRIRHLANTIQPSIFWGDTALCQITLTTLFQLLYASTWPVIISNTNECTSSQWVSSASCQFRSALTMVIIIMSFVHSCTLLTVVYEQSVQQSVDCWVSCCGLGLLIDIQKFGCWILAPISGYGNTHTIIENGAQTVRVCTACLDTVERIIHWYSETWYVASPPASDRCSSRHLSHLIAVQSPQFSCSKDSGHPLPHPASCPAAGRDLQCLLLISFRAVAWSWLACKATYRALAPVHLACSLPVTPRCAIMPSLPHIKRCRRC